MSEIDLEVVRKLSSTQLSKFASLEEFLSFAIQAQHRLIQLADEVKRLQDYESDAKDFVKMLDGICGELEMLGYRPDDYGGTETALTAIRKVREEIKQFQEALEFYADEKNWQDKLDYWGSTVERAKIKTDGGEIARTILHPKNPPS